MRVLTPRQHVFWLLASALIGALFLWTLQEFGTPALSQIRSQLSHPAPAQTPTANPPTPVPTAKPILVAGTEATVSAYQNCLGRDPKPQDVAGRLGRSPESITKEVCDSEEARRLRTQTIARPRPTGDVLIHKEWQPYVRGDQIIYPVTVTNPTADWSNVGAVATVELYSAFGWLPVTSKELRELGPGESVTYELAVSTSLACQCHRVIVSPGEWVVPPGEWVVPPGD
jgi:hypothetical protein